MLGKDLQAKLKIWDNETIRYYLILRSAGFRETISILREKHKLKGLAGKTIKKKLVTFGTKTPLDHDVDTITDEFGIRRHFVERVFSEHEITDLNILLGYAVPIYHAPITDTGAYIKISPLTSRKMVMYAYKSIKATYQEWEAKAEKGTQTPKVLNRSTKRKNIVKLTALYVAIEEAVYDNYQYKKEQGNNDDQNPSTMNQIYEESGKLGGFPQKKGEQKDDYIARIRNIYLVDILNYYSLPRFSESKELFKTLKLRPTS